MAIYEKINGKWVNKPYHNILESFKSKDVKKFVTLVGEFGLHHLREELDRDQNISKDLRNEIITLFEINQFVTVNINCEGRNGWCTSVNHKVSDKSINDYFMIMDGVTSVEIVRPEIWKEFA